MQIQYQTCDDQLSPHGTPMTAEVLRRLEAEADRLAIDIPLLRALARRDGVTGDPEAPTILAAGDLQLASRRLEVLQNVMAKGYVVQPDGRAVVGSRVTVRCVDGEQETYELVAPGETEARLRRISPDSPFGAALLGRRAGEVAHVLAPAGAEVLTVLSVA